MTRIDHGEHAHFIVLWADFLEICGGDLAAEPQVKIPAATRAAAALLHWFDCRSDYLMTKNGPGNSSETPWLSETHAQLQRWLLHEYGEKAIRDGLHILEQKVFIAIRPAPIRRHENDNTKEYRLNYAAVQTALDAIDPHRKNAVSIVSTYIDASGPDADIVAAAEAPGSVPSPFLGRSPFNSVSGDLHSVPSPPGSDPSYPVTVSSDPGSDPPIAVTIRPEHRGIPDTTVSLRSPFLGISPFAFVSDEVDEDKTAITGDSPLPVTASSVPEVGTLPFVTISPRLSDTADFPGSVPSPFHEGRGGMMDKKIQRRRKNNYLPSSAARWHPEKCAAKRSTYHSPGDIPGGLHTTRSMPSSGGWIERNARS